VDADVEAKARAIADQAKSQRKRLPRSAWSVSLAVALVCVAALVIGYVMKPEAPAETPPVHVGNGISVPAHTTISPMFGTPFLIGVAAGVAIGIAIGRRLASRPTS